MNLEGRIIPEHWTGTEITSTWIQYIIHYILLYLFIMRNGRYTEFLFVDNACQPRIYCTRMFINI